MENINDYRSPSIKEIELICNNIICQSPGGTGGDIEPPESGDEEL